MKTNSLGASLRVNKSVVMLLVVFTIIVSIQGVYASLGTYKACDTIQIKTILNVTSVNISTISYPNSTIAISNKAMTKKGQTFTYDFNNTCIVGIYVYDYFNSNGDVYVNDFEITPSGVVLDIQQSLLFLALFILFLLFLVGGIYGLSNSVSGAWSIGYICLAWISLFCIFFISWYFSVNYLWAAPILTSIFWILWFTMGVCFLPFIIILSIYIIGKGVKENLEREFVGQGYSREEAKDMSKRRKR